MSAFALKLERVEPIGTRRTQAFVNRGHADDGTPLNHSFEEIDLDVFPDDAVAAGRELREIRRMVGLNLREAAKALGISAMQVSELERGQARADRDAVLDAYRRSAGAKGGTP